MSNLQYSSDEPSSAESTPRPFPHFISESEFSPDITTSAVNTPESSSNAIADSPATLMAESPESITVKADSPSSPPPHRRRRYFPQPIPITGNTTDILRDREQKLIAALLIKFKDIVDLSESREGSEGSSDERLTAATQAYQIEVKTAELVRHSFSLLLHLSNGLR